MENFVNQFTGVGAINSLKSLVTMKSGKAELKSVAFHVSKTGNPTVKLVFESVLDKKQGHVEYLRLSTVRNFIDSFGRLKYIFAATGKEEHRNLLAELPAPFAEAKDKSGNAITFQTEEERQELVSFIPGFDYYFRNKDRDDKTRVGLIWNDKKAYAEKFAEIAQPLVGCKYYIKVEDTDGIQQLKMIKEAIV